MARMFHKPDAFNHRQTYPFVLTSDAAGGAATTQSFRVPALVFPNLVAVGILAFRTDRGRRSGAAIDTVRFKAKPVEQPGLFGGDVWHPFSAQDTQQQTAVLWEGAFLRAGEAMDVELMVGTAGRYVDFIVDRILYFNY